MPWDTDGLKYSNLQQGMGKYSLCQECNNNTGAWYGDAYVFFARVVNEAVKDYINMPLYDQNYTDETDGDDGNA